MKDVVTLILFGDRDFGDRDQHSEQAVLNRSVVNLVACGSRLTRYLVEVALLPLILTPRPFIGSLTIKSTAFVPLRLAPHRHLNSRNVFRIEARP